jgi:hypothetical protein
MNKKHDEYSEKGGTLTIPDGYHVYRVLNSKH